MVNIAGDVVVDIMNKQDDLSVANQIITIINKLHETIEDLKKELLLGQLKRNVVVTHEIASLLKEDTLIDAEGLRVLAYTEDVLKVTSKVEN